MYKIKVLITIFFIFFYPKTYAVLSNKGVEFYINQCKSNTFYENAYQGVRRYQMYESIARSLTNDEKIIRELVMDKINEEKDELFLYRQNRDKNITDKNQILRNQLLDVSTDTLSSSILKVFIEFPQGGNEVRIKRRLNEECERRVVEISKIKVE